MSVGFSISFPDEWRLWQVWIKHEPEAMKNTSQVVLPTDFKRTGAGLPPLKITCLENK